MLIFFELYPGVVFRVIISSRNRRAFVVGESGKLKMSNRPSVSSVFQVRFFICCLLAGVLIAGDSLSGFPHDRESNVEAILRQLKSSNEEVRLDASKQLREVDHAVVRKYTTEIAASLKDPSWRVRSNIVRVLRQLGEGAHPVIPELVKALDDIAATALLAEETLLLIGKDAVPALIAGLSHNDLGGQTHAALVLGKMGRDALPAIPHLHQLMKKGHARTHFAAARAIIAIVLVQREQEDCLWGVAWF